MDAHTINLPLSSIGANFPHENLDAFWGPYASAESAMVYPVPTGQGFAQGIIPENYRVPGLKFGVKVMNGSQLVRVEEYQVTGVQTYKKLILTEDDINLPQDIAEVFVCHNDAQGYDDLNAAVQAGKIIMWEGNVVNVLHNSTQGVYRLSYVGGDGLVHCYNVFSSSPSAATKENIPLARADEYLYYGSGTTFVELNSWVSSHKPVKVNGYVANVVQDSQTQYTLKYVDGDGVLHIITHTSSDTKTTATKDLSESVHIDADDTNNVFAIKDNKGTTIGSITLGTNATNGAAELTFVAGSNQFTATLPNLTYDSTNQMLKYIDAGGDDNDLIRLSNLQIKEVIANGGSITYTQTPAMGDLILEADGNGGYDLEVWDENNNTWQPLGSINNVSLVADQVALSSTKLNATNVKGGLEELYDKVDAVGASYWVGSIGISSATAYSSVSGLTEYNKQSEPIDVYVTTAGYLWIVSSVKIIAETSGIEIPMLAPVKSGYFYYYRSEEVVKESISVMVKALAKQEGTDPNDNITISGDALETVTKTAGDAYVTLSLPTITSNNGGILSYQWEKEGQAISGANSQTYEVGGTNQDQELVESDSGHYRCKVTNSLGGYEYTKGTILVVNASQGGGGDITPSGEGWLENRAVVNGAIVENTNYILSPVYEIDPTDKFAIYTGFNNSDSSLKVISGWDSSNGGNYLGGWTTIPYKSKFLKVSTSTIIPNCQYIRVMFLKDVISKCFIYNMTKGTWLYGGSAIQTMFNGFEFYKYIRTGVNYGRNGVLTIGETEDKNDSWSETSISYTHLSPLIPITIGHTYTVKNNVTGSNSDRAMMIFYKTNTSNEQVPILDSSEGVKYWAIGTNGIRSGLYGTNLATHARIFIFAENPFDCYIYDETSDEYLWKGVDVTN